MHKKFDHKDFEAKWQKNWEDSGIYRTTESDKPKTFVLDMFPYPSGEGLHVGHPKGYIATDIYSRFKRMSGYEVLHPMGWDAFGLPAENYAIKNKVHPRAAVEKNVARFKDQLRVLGFDYDWEREINTTDPEYYKWTQWIFIQLFKKGLAYESHEPINWCPGCQTGLANEDLEADGTCERCDSVVEKRPMRQWVLKIREYADRMLADLDTLEWPEHIKEAQRNWIGRSKGAEIDFTLSTGETVTVFTTRPDTLYGATYMVLAPEHPLVTANQDKISNWEETVAYVEATKLKNEQDRLNDTKEKTGVKLEGITATNPASGETIPVYIADYVLAGYGTGAIMAVPAHDERDNAFAKKFGIEIKEVVAKDVPALLVPKVDVDTKERHGAYVLLENSDGEILIQFNRKKGGRYELPGGGIKEEETIQQTAQRECREEAGYSNFKFTGYSKAYNSNSYNAYEKTNTKGVNTYIAARLISDEQIESDWQENEEIAPKWVSKKVLLEHIEKYDFGLIAKTALWDYLNQKIHIDAGVLCNSEEFDGMSSEEAKIAITEKVGGRMTNTYKIKDWVFSRQRYWGEPIPIIHCEKCGPVAVPEEQLPVTLPEVENYEPAGDGQSPLANITDWVNTACPTCSGPGKRETNTMPQWAGSSWYYLRFMEPKNNTELVSKENEAYWSPVDVYVGGDHAVRHLIYARFWHKFLYDINVVSTLEPFQRLEFLGFILAEDGRKMSKRWGNVINPDDIVDLVGADTMRVYEMFMGPFENTIAWSQDGLAGARRFLERVNGLKTHISETEPIATTRQLHKTIKKVAEDIEGFKFNTAVSSMMIFINVAEKEGLSLSTYQTLLKLLAPFAPHLTEELWSNLGNETSVHLEAFPEADMSLVVDDEVTIGVQINGKVRGDITIAPDADESAAMAAIKQHESLQAKIADGKIKKVIYKPGKILNIIVN